MIGDSATRRRSFPSMLLLSAVAVLGSTNPAIASSEQDNRLGVANGQETEDQLVDERENGGVGADSERQRQDSHGGEYGRFSQRAKGKLYVLGEMLHKSLNCATGERLAGFPRHLGAPAVSPPVRVVAALGTLHSYPKRFHGYSWQSRTW